MYKEIVINNLDEMKSFAEEIGKSIFPGFLLCLEGDLGAGKTTFTKFFGASIGITEVINSPTFTILKIYEGVNVLYHMDVYRLENIGYDYELDDYIYGDGVSVIEWYQYISSMLPKELLKIAINVNDSGERIVTINGEGRYEKIVKDISYRYSN